MEGENPSFLNQVVKAEYGYRPSELLSMLERVERNLDRTDKGDKKPRTIDLDILLFGDQIVKTENLTIPHREFLNRAFAMIPALQIEPDLVHPVTKKPVAEFVDEADKEKVIIYKDHVARIV
jgi:2-amino-4-hydroxy-6-hydroxymethyldihydropteridine diphosphokinase